MEITLNRFINDFIAVRKTGKTAQEAFVQMFGEGGAWVFNSPNEEFMIKAEMLEKQIFKNAYIAVGEQLKSTLTDKNI